ncbi:MAG: hypothetical protein PVH68_15090 [Armatimonadota bacterium]|jgi:hypothetical protein
MTWRVVLLCIAIMIVSSVWIQYAALLTLSAQVAMAVPPVPALVGFVCLLGYAAVARRLPGAFRLSRRELLIIYCVLCLSVAMCGGGALRFFLPSLPTLQYHAHPDNEFAAMAEALPPWYAPTDAEAIRTYFEGADMERVPWRHWALPLAGWSCYFLLFMTAVMCMCVLFFRPWNEGERLRFPLVALPLELVSPGEPIVRRPALLRDPLTWVGVAIIGIYNLLNILRSFNPSVPALPQQIPLQQLFTEGPLRNIWWLRIDIHPVLFGFGYLMTTDLLFSSWAFLVLLLGEYAVINSLGYQIPGAPFESEQSAGAYIAMAVFLVWMARRHVAEAARAWVDPENSSATRVERWAVLGLPVCLAGVALWHYAAGMLPRTLIPFYTLLFIFAIGAVRIRSEAGLPTLWLQPLEMATNLPINALGSAPFAPRGSLRNLTILGSSHFLPRGYFGNLGAYQMEGLKIAQDGGIRARHMVQALTYAVGLGLAFGIWLHLSAYYMYGANVLEGGTTEGGYRIQLYLRQYRTVSDYIQSPVGPDRTRTLATLAGFVQAGVLIVLRRAFLRFPLHPLGFVFGLTWGRQSQAMLFSLWLIKSLIIRLGSVRLYRRLLPLFLGIAFGHLIVAGLIWGLISTFGGEAFRGYVVWFH